MVEWHHNLKLLRAEQKRLQLDDRADKEVLTNLENRQEMQRPDVERMRQRGDIERKIKNLDFLRPIVEYKDFFQLFSQIKETKARLEDEQKELKKQVEPAMRSLTAKENYVDQINTVKEHRHGQVQRLLNTASIRGKRIEELDASIKDLNGKIEAEKKSGKKHREEALAAKQSINKLQRQMNEEVVAFDPDFYNERLVSAS